MHLVVFHELNKMRVNKQPEIFGILPEKTVLLEKHGSEREGRFDFLVQAKNKTIGIEVLTRPSQGKLKAKLPYAKEVDEFVFVLPHDGLEFYRRKKLNGFKRVAPKKFLSKEFADPKLQVWLLDYKQGLISEKGKFSEIFEIK
jgi:hypothetical protein